jgi:hypothetical protein
MRIENAQKTITVIVDRRVLAELLEIAAANDKLDWKSESEPLYRLAQEVESGERCELYARDWPTQAAGSGGSGRAE